MIKQNKLKDLSINCRKRLQNNAIDKKEYESLSNILQRTINENEKDCFLGSIE